MFELHFTCPRQGRDFRSTQWTVDPDLETVTTPNGHKHLRGSVRVPCPLCLQTHLYDPNELACPLEASNTKHATNQPPDL